jgi:Fe-S-cluster-containing dehydrogenase component/DMSO reductase anchor subunit
MRKGFIFNHSKCVACNSCAAACVLENGWPVHPRTIFTFNSGADSILPVINLSLACNHCEKPICMTGCPASAYSRESSTGAILIDENKCIGCRYCQWNCPYDAPKFDIDKKIILKCNLCQALLAEGGIPACASGCPTGALGYGETGVEETSGHYSWFPDKNLSPSVKFTSEENIKPLKIIPEPSERTGNSERKDIPGKISSETSLILFSFLSTISVSMLLTSVIRGIFPVRLSFIVVLLLSGLVSLFHLGKKLRFWRAVLNPLNSPLSLEITAFIMYGIISFTTVLSQLPALLLAASIAGLILLLSIDRVYVFADSRKSVILHSGQTFISALIITSFISGSIVTFIFMAIIKLFLSFYRYFRADPVDNHSTLRFLRVAFLVIPALSLIMRNASPDIYTFILFLTGELFDRILFYMDYSPIHISKLIEAKLNTEKNEKKRY